MCFAVFKSVRDYQIQNLVETRFSTFFAEPNKFCQPSAAAHGA